METKEYTDSKVVSKIAYEESTKTLFVTYTTSKQYAYHNVPKTVWKQCLESESIGRFIHNVIKKEYHFKPL